MEKLTFAETVIERAHYKTLRGELQWKINASSVTVELTPAIYVMFNFDDDGPDSATWESIMIKHPVGKGMTILGNPGGPKARLYDGTIPAETLNQLNEIFRYVLLDPRQKDFEAAMKELG